MNHLSEEELVDYYYGEDAAESRAETGRHLEACTQCAQAFRDLESDLKEIKAGGESPAFVFSEPPAGDASYGRRVWAALASSLEPYPVRKRAVLRLSLWQGLAYAAACAVLVTCAFYAGRQWEHRQSPVVAHVVPRPAVKQPVVIVVLGDHLDRSERLLVELKHTDADNEQMAVPLRDEARTLLAANRICRQNAKNSDDPALTKALDRLDHLLAELASQKDDLDPATIERLQKEMNQGNLLFEVRVLRTRIPDRQASAGRSQGGTI
jgi:hypothetical protein